MQAAGALLRPSRARPRAGRRRRPSRPRSRPWREPHGAARRGCRSRDRGSPCRRRTVRRRRAAKFASRRRPCAEDFSGWNWTPKSGRAVDDGHERARRTRLVPSTSSSLGRARRERVHVVEGAAAAGRPAVSGDGRSKRDHVPADVRELAARRRRAARPRRGSSPRPVGAAELDGARRTAAACPGRCRARARPRRRARGSARRGRARARLRHRLRERAHAGHDEPVGRAQLVVVAGDRRARAPTCSSAFSTERRLPIP